MKNKFSIDNQHPAYSPPIISDPSQKTKEEPKIRSYTQGCFPNLTSSLNHVVNSVKQNVSEFNQKIRRTLQKIKFVFNVVVLDKQMTSYYRFKKSSVSPKQTEIFKNSLSAFNTVSSTESLPLHIAATTDLSSFNPQPVDALASIIKTKNKSPRAKKDFKNHVNKKLSPDVEVMNQSLTKSSEILRQLAEEPAAKGESINCKEAVEHLIKINAELINMKNSTKKVHDDLDDLKKLLKETPKGFGYHSLDTKQKQVFVDARIHCQDLAQAIGPVKHFFSTDRYAIFGTKENPRNHRFKKEMTIKMNNPLLNCEIKINSKKELRQLRTQCKESDQLLSSFREDIPYIQRFAAEDSFRKVDKRVNYR